MSLKKQAAQKSSLPSEMSCHKTHEQMHKDLCLDMHKHMLMRII